MLQLGDLLEGGRAGVGEFKGKSEESLPLGRSELKQPIGECPGLSPEAASWTELGTFSTFRVAC